MLPDGVILILAQTPDSGSLWKSRLAAYLPADRIVTLGLAAEISQYDKMRITALCICDELIRQVDVGAWKAMLHASAIVVLQSSPDTHRRFGEAHVIIRYDDNAEALEIRVKQLLSVREMRRELFSLKRQIHYFKDVIWSCDPHDFTITYINAASTELYGYRPHELIGSRGKIRALVEEAYQADLDKAIAKLLSEGEATYEYRLRRPDGVTKQVFNHASLIRNAIDEPETIQGLSVDVTELRETQAKLKQTARQVEEIMDSITDAFYALNYDWEFTYVNRAFEKLFNTNRENLLGKNIHDCFPNFKNTVFVAQYRRTMREKISLHQEGYSPSSGKWLYTHTYPAPGGIAVYIQDVTEQHELAEQVINEEMKMRSLMNNTADIIWSVDREYQVMSANDAFYHRLNKNPVNVGRDILESEFDAGQVARWTSYYDRALKGEHFRVTEKSLVADKEVYEEISFNPIYDKEGQITGVSCISRDVTEQNQTRMVMEEQNRRLRQIAWKQSHGVRRPVSNILGIVHLMRLNPEELRRDTSLLEMLQTSAEELDQMIRDIVEQTAGIENPAPGSES